MNYPLKKCDVDMESGTPFKICIIVSICIHLSIIYPWPFLRSIHKPEIRLQKIELVYYQEDPKQEIRVKDFKPITYKEKKIAEPYTKPTLLKKIDISEKVSIEFKKEETTAKEEKISIAKNKTSDIDKESKTEKSEDNENISDKEMVYMNYKLAIREMIRSVIEKNCKRIPKEGDVSVRFVIDRNGNIKKMALYKTSGRGMKFLENIALRSIKEASPFPPFSEEMKEKQLPLILPIRFTRH